MGDALIRQDWEGRSIDGKIPLLEWLGGAGDRGVFLTVRQGTQKAAIKLFVAAGEEADAYTAQWEAARSLTHPNLMPMLEFGRCKTDGVEIVYIITERADASLAQILKSRAIEPAEAKSLFDPIIGALAFLHGHKVIHGHVKPTNVLSVGGKWKLASDDLWLAGGVTKQVGHPDDYNAPEALDGKLTSAVDSWSVGMTLSQALTRQLPKWNWSNGGAPAVPGTLSPEFARAVRECLRMDPQERCTMTQLRLRLDNVADDRKQEPSQQTRAAEMAAPIAAIEEAASEQLLIQEAPVAPMPVAEMSTAESTSAGTTASETQIAQSAVPEAEITSLPVQKAVSDEAPSAQIPATPAATPQATPVEKPGSQTPAPEPETRQGSPAPAPSAKEAGAPEVKREASPGGADPGTSSRAKEPASHARPVVEEAQHETPFESSRPRQGRMLFALGDYEEAAEEDRPRRRIWPWVLGGVVVLGGAAYLGVHFGTGNPPTSSISQNAPTSSQPSAQTQPAPQAQTQPASPQPAPQQPATAQSAPTSTAPAGSQTAQPSTQPQQTAQPATNAAPPATATAPPAVQAPASTPSPAPVPAAKDKNAVAPSPRSDEGRTMEGVSRPPKGRGARASDAEENQAARPPNANGEVRDRVVPSVSPAARSSMRRPIEVEIRVAVDRLGTVERTEYMDHGPGNYFARTAYRAAHDWKFAPPLRDGRPQASVWLLTFSFTRHNTEVTAREEDR